MPRPNRGPQLKWVEKRNCFYVVWYQEGRERLRSLHSASEEESRQRWRDYVASNPDLSRRGFSLELAAKAVALQAPRIPDTVYFIGGDVGAIKIGVAVDAEKRLTGLQCGSPIVLRILATCPGDRGVESDYHRRFGRIRLHGEWFQRSPELLAEIVRLNSLAEYPDTVDSIGPLFGAAA